MECLLATAAEGVCVRACGRVRVSVSVSTLHTGAVSKPVFNFVLQTVN